MTRILLRLFFVLPALLLAGCGREPTEQEMEYAMTALIQDTLDSFAQSATRQGYARRFEGFDSFKKLGCTAPPANGQGYNCEFSYSGNIGGALGAVPMGVTTATARFRQSERGWSAEMGLGENK